MCCYEIHVVPTVFQCPPSEMVLSGMGGMAVRSFVLLLETMIFVQIKYNTGACQTKSHTDRRLHI